MGAADHKVAITFDDGPDPRWTPQILDTLKRKQATATFFVIGEPANQRGGRGPPRAKKPLAGVRGEGGQDLFFERWVEKENR